MTTTPHRSGGNIQLLNGDCQTLMATLPDQSISAIICDPPYPCIDRAYGRLTEPEWHDLMRVVVAESRRVLKPSGSAVFILQPNSERVGRMRAWLWEFMAWTCREWGMVQDVWWWNHTMAPTVHCQTDHGLMRPSVKACVWLGASDCYRDQAQVLWAESDSNRADRLSDRVTNKLEQHASTMTMRRRRCSTQAVIRGGTTPFNILPIGNQSSREGSGSNGHGAGTPHDLADWWVRYISPPDGVVLDPFAGVGTIPLAALMRGRKAIAIERDPGYFATMKRRVERPHLVVPRPRRDDPEPRDWLFAESEVAG